MSEESKRRAFGVCFAPDEAERRGGVRGGSDNVRSLPWGLFPNGKPYVSDCLPWASYDPTTREVVIDEAVAASYGVRARYDDATLSVVLGGF